MRPAATPQFIYDFAKRTSTKSDLPCFRDAENGLESALHLAVADGHEMAVVALLAAGANPNAFEEASGESPLHVASKNKKAAGVVLILLNAGADVNAVTKGLKKETALLWLQKIIALTLLNICCRGLK